MIHEDNTYDIVHNVCYISDNVLQVNIPEDRVKGLFTGAIPLMSYEVIHITGELIALHTLHCFELIFNSVPITLYFLGVHTIGSIDKLNSVVDRVMLQMRYILGYPGISRCMQPIHPSGL